MERYIRKSSNPYFTVIQSEDYEYYDGPLVIVSVGQFGIDEDPIIEVAAAPSHMPETETDYTEVYFTENDLECMLSFLREYKND